MICARAQAVIAYEHIVMLLPDSAWVHSRNFRPFEMLHATNHCRLVWYRLDKVNMAHDWFFRAGAMPYMYLAGANMGIADKITSLCVPLGVTFNAAGSSIFISGAVIFLAQINSLSLEMSHLFTLLWVPWRHLFTLLWVLWRHLFTLLWVLWRHLSTLLWVLWRPACFNRLCTSTWCIFYKANSVELVKSYTYVRMTSTNDVTGTSVL